MDAETQIEGFIAKFTDQVAAEIRAARAEMRRRLPGAYELVYDNYNALAIGYGPNEKTGQAVFSLACFPRRVSLCFVRGVDIDDPKGLLEGDGNQVRFLPLSPLTMLDQPDVQALWDQALAKASAPIGPPGAGRTIVKSISAKQRPRRPT
ncbi:hypothetical protein [Phenylobacterium sp.]|uniref:hypothetical protein n=1 Tax=Phenylobacterium sp. TaxID=1871053 RepID=UPI002DF26016|nr:hypothetical protein [Phenylobacterium sp.]